jgi:hypothetical protein
METNILRIRLKIRGQEILVMSKEGIFAVL